MSKSNRSGLCSSISVEDVWAPPLVDENVPLLNTDSGPRRSQQRGGLCGGLSVEDVWAPPPSSGQQKKSVLCGGGCGVDDMWAPHPDGSYPQEHPSQRGPLTDTHPPVTTESPPRKEESMKSADLDFRPERVFKALQGQSCDVEGNFRFDVGSRVWMLTGEKGVVSIIEITGVKACDLAGPFVASVMYDKEKTWVRSLQGKVSDVKLLVMGKLKFTGSQARAAKLEGLFKNIEHKLRLLEEAESKDTVGALEGGEQPPETDDDGDEDDADYAVDPAVIAQLKKSRGFCFTYYFLIDVSWGIWTALYTYYIEDVLYDDSSDDDSTSSSVMISTWALLTYSFAHFLTSPGLGVVTDSIGRRPIILIGCFTNMIIFTLWGFVTSPLWWVLVGIIAGFDNSTAAIYTVLVDCAVLIPADEIGDQTDFWIHRWVYYGFRPANYDLTKPDISVELRCGFMLMWTYVLVGLIAGDFLGAIIYELVGLTWGMASAGLILIPMLVYLYLYLPETLQPYQKKEASIAVVCDAFFDQLRNVDVITASPLIATLTLLYCVSYTVQSASFTVYLFWLEDKYGWGEGMVALFLFAMYLMIPISAYIVNSIAIPAMGFERAFFLSYFIAGVGYVLNNFASQTWQIWIVGFFPAPSWACYILMLGIITPLVGHSDAGRLQGALYSLGMLASCVGMYGGYLLYDATLNDNYGAPLWYCSGVGNLFSAILCLSLISMTRVSKLQAAS